MTVYIFTGPTLSAEEGKQELDAIYLPPAAQGDVYLAAREQPIAIGIVDGYFERVPSVAHKEVLWAMAQGVHVFGCSSMGALRAAELAAFGMEGVGEIYQAFAGGLLKADDEVAVTHAAAEDGYRALSEAMVNIRATLAAAAAAGVISTATEAALETTARSLFYPDRCYPIILARAREAGVDTDELTALAAFLPAGRVDRKRADAVAMLRTMREWLSGAPEPKRVRYHFEHTDAWEHIRATVTRPVQPRPFSSRYA
jgi:hypothetical protein